jgi:hypothetical protein
MVRSLSPINTPTSHGTESSQILNHLASRSPPRNVRFALLWLPSLPGDHFPSLGTLLGAENQSATFIHRGFISVLDASVQPCVPLHRPKEIRPAPPRGTQLGCLLEGGLGHHCRRSPCSACALASTTLTLMRLRPWISIPCARST